jgi:hypothetical protein
MFVVNITKQQESRKADFQRHSVFVTFQSEQNITQDVTSRFRKITYG